MAKTLNLFGAEAILNSKAGDLKIYRLDALTKAGIGHVDKLPFSIKVLLESCLRNLDNFEVGEEDVVEGKDDGPKEAGGAGRDLMGEVAEGVEVGEVAGDGLVDPGVVEREAGARLEGITSLPRLWRPPGVSEDCRGVLRRSEPSLFRRGCPP